MYRNSPIVSLRSRIERQEANFRRGSHPTTPTCPPSPSSPAAVGCVERDTLAPKAAPTRCASSTGYGSVAGDRVLASDIFNFGDSRKVFVELTFGCGNITGGDLLSALGASALP
jgi:hypothetical protein